MNKKRTFQRMPDLSCVPAFGRGGLLMLPAEADLHFAQLSRRSSVMRTMLTMGLCGALVGLTTLLQPALAQQKTAKQCNDEWKADKIAIQASGKTKKVFVAECRGFAVGAAKPIGEAEPAGQGQHATESDAKATCPTDNVVWVNLNSYIYHASSSKSYGKTKRGAYMCKKGSVAAGFRAPKLATRS